MNYIFDLGLSLLDVFATPAVLLGAYNGLAPRMFGLRRLDYSASCTLIWALRALFDAPLAIQWAHAREVRRTVANVRHDETDVEANLQSNHP